MRELVKDLLVFVGLYILLSFLGAIFVYILFF